MPCDYGSTLFRIMLGNCCQDVGSRVGWFVVAVSPVSQHQPNFTIFHGQSAQFVVLGERPRTTILGKVSPVEVEFFSKYRI